jgi:hypothetical protein
MPGHSWISRLIRCLLAIPIAVTSIRKDLAVRPCFPMTFPISARSTEMRKELPSLIGTHSTLTSSGWSTISLINTVIASAMSFECSMMKTPFVFPISRNEPASEVVPGRCVLRKNTNLCSLSARSARRRSERLGILFQIASIICLTCCLSTLQPQ